MKVSDFRSHKVFLLLTHCFTGDYKHGFEIRATFKLQDTNSNFISHIV
jgi:hypothetical protein